MTLRSAYKGRYGPLLEQVKHSYDSELLLALCVFQVDRTFFMEAQDRKADTPYVDSIERQLRSAISDQASSVAEKADKQSLEALRDTHHMEIQNLQSQLQALTSGLSRLDDRVCFWTRGYSSEIIIAFLSVFTLSRFTLRVWGASCAPAAPMFATGPVMSQHPVGQMH